MGLEGDGDTVAFDLDAAHEFAALLDVFVANDGQHKGCDPASTGNNPSGDLCTC